MSSLEVHQENPLPALSAAEDVMLSSLAKNTAEDQESIELRKSLEEELCPLAEELEEQERKLVSQKQKAINQAREEKKKAASKTKKGKKALLDKSITRTAAAAATAAANKKEGKEKHVRVRYFKIPQLESVAKTLPPSRLRCFHLEQHLHIPRTPFVFCWMESKGEGQRFQSFKQTYRIYRWAITSFELRNGRRVRVYRPSNYEAFQAYEVSSLNQAQHFITPDNLVQFYWNKKCQMYCPGMPEDFNVSGKEAVGIHVDSTLFSARAT